MAFQICQEGILIPENPKERRYMFSEERKREFSN
jgi:hypothetical protein